NVDRPYAASYCIGVKGGLFLSMFYGNDAHLLSRSEILPRKDFSASLFFRTGYNKHFSGQIELTYAKKGNREYLEYNSTYYEYPDFLNRNNRWEELYKLDYIELPILLNYRVHKSGRNEISLYTGPFLAILFNAKKNTFDNDTILYSDIQSSTRQLDYGINSGIEYVFRFGKSSVSFDMRYSIGFASTHRPSAIDIQINPSVHSADRKNSGLLFLTGFMYAL
ncbi:MAG: PorT family protein, partial [Candidatus Pacearchaeota archaeon]|nr:PorT family protein [Candidatus Pacearchaeota archaeon]